MDQSGDLQHIVSKWYKILRYERGCSANTIDSYNYDILDFFNFFDNYFDKDLSLSVVANFSTREFRSWISNRCRRGISQASNRRAVSAIKNFYQFLKQSEGVKNEHIAHFSLPKKYTKNPKVIEISEVKNILESVCDAFPDSPKWVNKRDIAIIMLMYGAGLRVSEVLNMSYFNIKKDGYILVKGKGNKERVVPLLPIVLSAINYYVELCPYPTKDEMGRDSILFYGERGRRLSRNYFASRIKKLESSLNIHQNISCHMFRHSFATHLLGQDVSIRVIQDLLGHSSLSTTQNYTKVEHSRLQNIHKQFNPRDSLGDNT